VQPVRARASLSFPGTAADGADDTEADADGEAGGDTDADAAGEAGGEDVRPPPNACACRTTSSRSGRSRPASPGRAAITASYRSTSPSLSRAARARARSAADGPSPAGPPESPPVQPDRA
jgi:hypothetical protein